MKNRCIVRVVGRVPVLTDEGGCAKVIGMSSSPTFAMQWLEQRRRAAVALQRVEDDELRALTDAEARSQTEALLAAAPIARMVEGRHHRSGLVDQQRIFARARR
jgi:hypothetical protein